MPDLDLGLQEICEKYGLSVCEGKKHYYEFLDAFQEVWDHIPDDEPIAFYGFGDAFNYMYNKVKSKPKNVVCIIENAIYRRPDEFNIPIIKTERIREYKFKRIILTGLASRHEMRRYIVDYDVSIEIIDMYEILEKTGGCYDKSFSINGPARTAELYLNLESTRMEYENSSSSKDSQKNLKLLIQAYLEYRDFVYSDFYIQEYINRRFDDSDSFNELKNELHLFFAGIKEKIKSKRNKNIFVFVLDSLSLDASQRMPFVKQFSKDSLSFCNAFAPGFNTRASTCAFLTGENYVESEICKIPYLERKDSDFLSEINASGCRVKHISCSYFTFLLKINDYDLFKIYNSIQPHLYWNLLTEIVNESENCIYFVHSMELHHPFYSGHPTKALLCIDNTCKSSSFSPKHEGTSDEILRQRHEHVEIIRDDALKYADSQLGFCLSLLNLDKDSVIITSDHQANLSSRIALDLPITLDMNKVPFIIRSKWVEPGIWENIYSTVYMPNLLRQMMFGNKKVKIDLMDYARQEMLPFYGKNLVRETLSTNQHYGRVVFTTDSEKYTFYFNGREEYFLLPDLETNLVINKQYQARINYFRRQIRIDTRELWKFIFKTYPILLKIHSDRAEEFINEDKNPSKIVFAAVNQEGEVL